MSRSNPSATDSISVASSPSIRDVAQQVRGLLAAADCEPQTLQPSLGLLRTMLAERQCDESEGRGLLQETAFEAPYLTAQVHALCDQLGWMKEQIDVIYQRVGQAEQDPVWLPMLRVQFDDFFEDFTNFEHALHSLRFCALSDDDD